jgi:hypothetical protein
MLGKDNRERRRLVYTSNLSTCLTMKKLLYRSESESWNGTGYFKKSLELFQPSDVTKLYQFVKSKEKQLYQPLKNWTILCG